MQHDNKAEPFEHYRRYRIAFQIATLVSGIGIVVIAKTGLVHWAYSFRVLVALVGLAGFSIVLGIVYRFKELAAHKAQLQRPPPHDPDRPWMSLNKDR